METNSLIKTSVIIASLFFSAIHATANASISGNKFASTYQTTKNFKKDQKSNIYKLANENLVFSFKTKNSKMMSLCIDKNGDYIIYRFGTTNQVELEFPKTKDQNSFNNFVYTGWNRGGGPKNEGMDLNYIAFVQKDYKYIIYETYFAVGDVSKVGIKIINLKTNKEIDIKGINSSKTGTLSDFRTDDRIKKGDQLYD